MQRLTALSLAHPRMAGLLLLLVSAGLGAGALRLETDVGYRSVLGQQHPSVARFDGFLERFGAGFPIAAVYSCEQTPRCESVFDPEALRMAASIAAQLERSDAVRRVESLATTPLLVPGDADPVLRTLVEEGVPVADRAFLAQRALRDSLWVRALVDAEGRVGAVVMEVASSEGADNAAAYAALDAALAPHEAAGFRFHRVGGAVEFVVASAELQADTARLVPGMVALIGVVLVALFRSLASALATLASVGTAVLWCFGAMGWLGWPQNSVSQALPPLLLVIGVCDAIHLLARYATRLGPGLRDAAARRRRLVEVAGEVGPPCLLTSLTTAGAFLSFATSGLESFVRFGVAAAFGVMGALILTFTLLPMLAVGIRPDRVRAVRASAAWERGLSRLVVPSERHPRAVVAATLVLTAASAVGFASLRVDASFEDLYGRESRVVRWVRFVSDALRRPDTLEVVLVPPGDGRPADPERLATLRDVARDLAAIEDLGPARTLSDAVSLVHQLASDDDPFWHRLPTRAEDAREILSLLEERDPRTLARWLDAETGRYRVSLEAEKPPQEVMRRIFGEVEAVLAARLPEGWRAELTGPLAVVHEMVDEIRRTQLESFAGAGLVVLVLVALFFRSARMACLAALPTLLPVLATLGVMGWLGASLDVGSAMVAAVVLGIAVDDAIHLLSEYRRHREAGETPAEAMRSAVLRVGRAVATTSIALTLGFAVLTLSSWRTIASFGALSGIAVLGALLSVLVVLPACVSALTRSEDAVSTRG